MIPGSAPIEKKVLQKITPSAVEKKHIQQVIEALKKQVKKEIKKTQIPITIQLVGSTAKDTYIRTSIDIDLFLVFPPTTPRKILQEKGLAIGRALLTEQEECYAEHPYVRGLFQGVKTELVPCYKITSATQKLSAVDRTPLHTTYVKNHLKATQKKEVRLLKQFLKGIGCYGAEAEIEGFSGYLCEIVVLRFGTFQHLIEQARTWQPGVTLTLTSGPIPNFSTPLTFIDPVDSKRNVASALSPEKFHLFIEACTSYYENPRLTFFFPRQPVPWSLKQIQKHLTTKSFIGVAFHKPDIIAENLYPQLRKAIRSIRDLCEQHGFSILDASFTIHKNQVYLLFHPKTLLLSKTILHAGPPISLKHNAQEFIQKWKHHPRTLQQPFEKDKRLYVQIEREYTDIRTLLNEQVNHLSLGKHIDLALRDGCTILDQKDLLRDDLRLFWTTYLDNKMPWER
ncbi:MAG: CCA tRNA nucleotidyltransferase [Candidatus Thermoplasmatota archaeon]|nr:CCA tRNA nucleotidyltransferase [Candidatus Thermoplasmatota archaeon]